MKLIDIKDGILLPNLGIAAASFGAFLTILNLSERSVNLKYAVHDFSTGIPLVLSCYFLIGFGKRFPTLHTALLYLNAFCIYGGNVFCLMGLYKCFYEIYPPAAENFKFITFWVLGLTFVLGVIQIFDDFKTATKKTLKRKD